MKFKLPSDPKKVIVWLIIAFAVILILRYGIKTISKITDAGNTIALAGDLNRDNLTYSPTQYETFADNLEEAIGSFSTSENTVYSIFRKMRNEDDVKQLVRSFGSRLFTYLSGKKTLAQYIHAGMGNKEIEEINNILSTAQINFSF